MANKSSSETPLMKQYYKIKGEHPDALLLFRVGDFYETFGEDAVKASKILGIVLTRRANGSASDMELAGFPFHSLDVYLPKLIAAGQRVAICEQLEDPKQTKTIVKRGITDIVTPGTSLSDKLLSHDRNNYLAALTCQQEVYGISLLDLSTGEFFLTQGDLAYIQKVMGSFAPAEVLYPKSRANEFERLFGEKQYHFTLDDYIFSHDFAYEQLTKHFRTHNLKGFGVEEFEQGITAAGAVLQYLEQNKHSRLEHINRIGRLEQDKYVWLDPFTVRNLELTMPIQMGGTPLFNILNHTCCPMGARLLKKWVLLPLRQKKAIEERLNTVEFILKNDSFADIVRDQLKLVGDLERLVARISLLRTNPREVIQLKRSLDSVAVLKELCAAQTHPVLQSLAEQMVACGRICTRIGETIEPEAPAQLAKGNVIREGISPELDEYRTIAHKGKDYLLHLQKNEAEKTGISSLKIGFNNVFGYYLEVTHTHKHKVPEDWIRKQTLTNAERYVTPELKDYEEKILQAEDRISELEKQLFEDLLVEIADYTVSIQRNAQLVARLDCLLSFAVAAQKYSYTRPRIDESYNLDIKEGRHPVIEQMLPLGEQYIPNDLYLDNETRQVIILTGPNMSGKSAILRQTALIVLMAQMGCYVPAASASIGLVDKVFTRVGASDNLSVGESTFMVEMTETANILNNISARSLILLDEIGRGTSTYDGISIAWALTEYLHEHPYKPKTLFATHYHELNELAANHPRIANFHVSVKDVNGKIIFLRKMQPGGSEHSFGIHVAQLAGVPPQVVSRANTILGELEAQRQGAETRISQSEGGANNKAMQLSMFTIEDNAGKRLREALQKIDINTTTPVEALMKLHQLKNLLKKES